MPEYKINGAAPLRGSVLVQGAKNSVLPLLAACILCSEKVQLSRVPQLSDVTVSLRLLEKLGCRVRRGEHHIEIDTSRVAFCPLEPQDCRSMRSSVLFLGPLLARCGRAELYLPGGCLLGDRPIDLHIAALIQMGAVFECKGDSILATAPRGLTGAQITLAYPSVGATENILMASVLAKGTTVLYNGAKEPEIGDLIEMLRLMGADIQVTKNSIEIKGAAQLHGCHKTVMADRIAAFTYMTAALVTDGEITLQGCPTASLGVPLEVLAEAGAAISKHKDTLTIRRGSPFILSVGDIVSGPYPAFPTDAGALVLALLSLGQGESRFVETVFSDRFKVVDELSKFGADISLWGNAAKIRGKSTLQGATVRATDLRAGAALLVAALAAEGESRVLGGEHIIRGYENIVPTLRSLGADITEIS